MSCLYCATSPVPHWPVWFNESLIVVLTPLNSALLNNRLGRAVEAAFDWVTPALVSFFVVIGVIKFNDDVSKCTIKRARVLWEEAERRGIKMRAILFFGKEIDCYTARIGNRTIYFKGLPRPDARAESAVLWMDDKAKLKEKFLAAGIPVARGGSFSSYDKLRQKFLELDKPVIVKPRLGSRGRHTTTFIYTEEQLARAWRVAKQLCHWVIMEEHLAGSVYRGTVIDGKLVGVLGGSPARITGDGTLSIAELIVMKNNTRPESVGEVVVNNHLKNFLARQNLTPETVLAAGQTIDLSEKVGVAHGGTSFEITPETHPDLRVILEKAARVVPDPILGFDFIIEDVSRSPSEQKWGIIECNGLPFINLHHDPLYGVPINAAAPVWDLWQ